MESLLREVADGGGRTDKDAELEEETGGGDEEPAVLEAGCWAQGASARLSDRKSSMEGLSRGRLSCCSRNCWRRNTARSRVREED